MITQATALGLCRGLLLLLILISHSNVSNGQMAWRICDSPAFENRVDDVFMADNRTGYAVSGDGRIVKTTNSGLKWKELTRDTSVYCRSVEFINPLKGFVGAFPNSSASTANILRRTTDGGETWTDLTPRIHRKAREGICGLSVADSMTIYGSGNWYGDSAYIIKSADGGETWTYIDMHEYARSLIDIYFLNKDTGFVTGRSPMPLATAIILYTTDGGVSWTEKFRDVIPVEYCWKIQQVTGKLFFASIQDFGPDFPRILKSTDGGMSWSIHEVTKANAHYNMEAVGFMDTLTGWSGGGLNGSYESTDGGLTWRLIPLCPMMNRFFRVNDTLAFASGNRVWRYGKSGDTIETAVAEHKVSYASVTCTPNPVHETITLKVSLKVNTRVMLSLCDHAGREIRTIENNFFPAGDHTFHTTATDLRSGIYYAVLKTHEADEVVKIKVR